MEKRKIFSQKKRCFNVVYFPPFQEMFLEAVVLLSAKFGDQLKVIMRNKISGNNNNNRALRGKETSQRRPLKKLILPRNEALRSLLPESFPEG